MILLDTHAWLWWQAEPTKLSAPALRAIRQAARTTCIGISALSCWEIAMLVAKERIGLSLDVTAWIAQALEHPAVQLLELSPTIAIASTRLTGSPPNDPVDRILIATAKTHNCAIVSKDRRIRSYPQVESIW